MKKITAKTTEEFREQFNCILQQEECREITGMVYFWMVEKPIPRILGESRILYIGQTSQSLNQRYSGSNFKTEIYNFETLYKHAIKKYGAIRIEIERTSDPEQREV